MHICAYIYIYAYICIYIYIYIHTCICIHIPVQPVPKAFRTLAALCAPAGGDDRRRRRLGVAAALILGVGRALRITSIINHIMIPLIVLKFMDLRGPGPPRTEMSAPRRPVGFRTPCGQLPVELGIPPLKKDLLASKPLTLKP